MFYLKDFVDTVFNVRNFLWRTKLISLFFKKKIYEMFCGFCLNKSVQF